jgi:GDP-4-dehydro-6-deoxy-D-mannose reductase
MGLEYVVAHGLDVVRVRPFLQLGPRRQDHFVAGTLARQIAEIEAGVREPVIEVGNVDLARDFTDVRDVTRAYRLIAERGAGGGVYNIASGSAHSLRDLLRIMLAEAGVQVDIRQSEERLRGAEAPLLVGDATRLREATDWAPEISFEKSAADTLAYWRDRVGQMLVRKGEGE